MSNEEFENIFGDVPFKNIKLIQEYINEKFISKEKIKAKIEELSKKTKNSITDEINEIIIEVLKSLLEKE